MRTNVYKQKILAALKNTHLLSIAALCTKIPKADFSTIFRNVEQLCIEGVVRKVIISKETTLYELSDLLHHHDHFVCTLCGSVESVHVSPNITLTGGAVISDILVRGTCTNCVV